MEEAFQSVFGCGYDDADAATDGVVVIDNHNEQQWRWRRSQDVHADGVNTCPSTSNNDSSTSGLPTKKQRPRRGRSRTLRININSRLKKNNKSFYESAVDFATRSMLLFGAGSSSVMMTTTMPTTKIKNTNRNSAAKRLVTTPKARHRGKLREPTTKLAPLLSSKQSKRKNIRGRTTITDDRYNNNNNNLKKKNSYDDNDDSTSNQKTTTKKTTTTTTTSIMNSTQLIIRKDSIDLRTYYPFILSSSSLSSCAMNTTSENIFKGFKHRMLARWHRRRRKNQTSGIKKERVVFDERDENAIVISTKSSTKNHANGDDVSNTSNISSSITDDTSTTRSREGKEIFKGNQQEKNQMQVLSTKSKTMKMMVSSSKIVPWMLRRGRLSQRSHVIYPKRKE